MVRVPTVLLVAATAAGLCRGERLKLAAQLNPAVVQNRISAMSAGGEFFAAYLPDGTVTVWETARGKQVASTRASATALAFTPDNRLAIADAAGVQVVDLGTNQASPLPGDWKNVTALAFSREAVAWAGQGSTAVEVRALRGGAVLRTIPGQSSAVQGIAFSPDGLSLVTGEFYRIARLWSLRTTCAQQVFTNSSSELHGLSFSNNGRWLAVTSDSGIQIADVVSGQEVQRYLPDAGAFLNAAFRADGSLVAVTADAGLKLWRSDALPFVTAAPANRPALHILVIGINAYQNPEWRLGFAEQDATDIASFFEQHADRLPYAPRSVRVLGSCATRNEIRSVLDDLARTAQADDALLVFMAGHGKQAGQEFYYYPFEMRAVPDNLLPSVALSASEIGVALRKIAARRQVLVLDACQSGAAVAAIRQAVVRSLPADRSTQIISAAANTEEAMEVEELGHGILTSALLERLRARLEGSQAESARALLQYARDEVPRKASVYNKSGSQKPEFVALGPDFAIMSAGNGARRPSAPAAPAVQPAPARVGGPLNCRPTSSDQTFVRPEGMTELIGDIVFRCSGELEVPSANLEVFFPTNSTSRLLPDGTIEATLVLEEPGTRTAPANYVLGKNTFRGRLHGFNGIRWEAVPLAAAGRDVDVQIRITSVRVNASGLGSGGSSGTTQLVAYYTIESPGRPLLKQTQIVSYIAGPLAPRLGRCGGTGGAPPSFTSTTPENAELASGASEQGRIQFGVRVRETFPDQYLPSAEALRRRALANGVPALAESADQGTRFVAMLNNLPAGVAVYATRSAERSVSSPQARAQLIATSAKGSGPARPAARDAVGACGDESLAMTRLEVIDSSALATWEVTSSDPLGIDTFEFGLMIAFESKPDKALPSLGTSTLNFDYAPTAIVAHVPSSAMAVASATAPIPRFSMSSTARNFFQISAPMARLLFPGMSNQAGLDSGISIENTSSGPGICSISYAAATPGGPVPPPQTSIPVAAGGRLAFTLSSGGSHGIGPAPGFQGCIQAVCRFEPARGVFSSWQMGSQPTGQRPAVLLKPGQDPKSVNAACAF